MSDIHHSLAQLREARGLSIEALAAAIRVSPAKLLALESGRYSELPNAAFTRALAMSVCRVLKADPKYILASLPSPDPVSVLTEMRPQQPFKSGHARLNLESSFFVQVRYFFKPRYLLPLFILTAAVAVFFWPKQSHVPPAPSVAQDASTAPVQGQAVLVDETQAVNVATLPSSIKPVELPASEAIAPVETAQFSDPSASAQALAPQMAAQVTPASAASTSVNTVGEQGNLVLQANDETWVQIKDASGDMLLRRVILAGERIALTGVLPLKIKVGNASAVNLSYQGQPVDLTEHTRANVARLELK